METTTTEDWKDDNSQLAPLLNDGEEVRAKRPPLRRRRSLLGSSFPFHQPRKICKIVSAAAFIALLALVFLAYLSYPHNNHISTEHPIVSSRPATPNAVANLEDEFRRTSMTHPPPPSAGNLVDYRDIVRRGGKFNTSTSDVMVFLHIQKTGGTTFGKHLVQDIDLEEPCTCESVPKKKKLLRKKKVKNKKNMYRIKCECLRPSDSGQTWLFSRYSTGWKCGLHPDWTELTSCVNNYLDATEGRSERRYFYVTFLRDPVSRFLSELKHVQRGATWRDANHICGGRPPAPGELPDCYAGRDWRGVGLDEFMGCESNLAFNRQTRMLADLELVNCYNVTGMERGERERIMLQSAKENLLRMAFFGLTEMQAESQYVFQETFGLRFKTKFFQYGRDHASKVHDRISEARIKKIERLNHLDMKLYEFAKEVMSGRFEEIKRSDPSFEENFGLLAKGELSEGGEENDEEDDYSY